MPKLLTLFALFFAALAPLAAYKDVYYTGVGYGRLGGSCNISPASFGGDKTVPIKKTDLTGTSRIFRFGYEFNYDKEHFFKNRLELSLEKRAYEFEFARHIAESSVRLHFAYLVGVNTGLFLSDELGVFGKFGFGYEAAKKNSKSADETFGLLVNYAFKRLEIFAGADLECRRRGAYTLIPIDFFTDERRQETLAKYYGGINIRF